MSHTRISRYDVLLKKIISEELRIHRMHYMQKCCVLTLGTNTNTKEYECEKISLVLNSAAITSIAMIVYVLATLSSLILLWLYKIISDEDQGFTYFLFCPKTRTVDGSKLRDAAKISKKGTIFKNTFDFINFNAGE